MPPLSSKLNASINEYETLPDTYRRLVAKHTGESFRDVATVVKENMFNPAHLEDDERIVRVLYAGVNGGCETFRCREGCGVVVAGPASAEASTGSSYDEASTLPVGSHVMFVGGAFSEYVKVKTSQCHLIKMSSKEMTALRISGHVAYAALTHVGHMKKDNVVLVTAAAGATGSFAVQFAKDCGCHVVATCRNSDKADILQSRYGVDRVINYSLENIEDVLRSKYGGLIDIAYEGVGGTMQALAWENLAPGGRLLSVGYISQYPHAHSGPVQSFSDSLPRPDELFWKGQTVVDDSKTAFGNVWPTDASVRQQALEQVCNLYAEGRVTPLIDDVRQFHGIESIPDAIDYMLLGNAIGKVVVSL
ncbi:Prostaglandin reductase-3 [Picochlorum sp. SENEW3]|nr:Prostaglandin reductase-3 [Picochlorum sp. SENEW3]